jgi:hypothetical protein
MPRYDFKCHSCKKITKNVILPITHRAGDLPVCCKEDMRYHITSAPQVLWKDGDLPDGGFVAGKDKRRINTRKERREFMAENSLVDSNDLYKPPTNEEQMDTHADVLKSVNAITPDAEQKQQLKNDGLLDIV